MDQTRRRNRKQKRGWKSLSPTAVRLAGSTAIVLLADIQAKAALRIVGEEDEKGEG